MILLDNLFISRTETLQSTRPNMVQKDHNDTDNRLFQNAQYNDRVSNEIWLKGDLCGIRRVYVWAFYGGDNC